LPQSQAKSSGSATSAITLLALASFAAQAMVRSTDSLLPQIAADLHVSVGATSIIVTAYLLAHGSVQLVIGPIGDRFGKYLCVAIAAAAGLLPRCRFWWRRGLPAAWPPAGSFRSRSPLSATSSPTPAANR
jgi:MFS family permease